MVLLGKAHEISFYGLITTIISLITGRTSFSILWEAAIHPSGFSGAFLCYLFWASAVFVPLAVICAFATKYVDYGEGIFFRSDNIVVIVFAHIAEEILGIVLTPFWFLRDIFTHNMDDSWKVCDYITYAIELVFICIGVLTL